MSLDEEHLLQTGFDAIAKAFKMKKGTSKTILKERETMISTLQSRITQLESENMQLKSTISLLQLENQQVKKQNSKLLSSLEDKKTKLQMIKKSIIESTLVIPTIDSNTSINSKITNKEEIHKEAPFTSIPNSIKNNRNSNMNMYQLYKKKQPAGYSTHRANSHSNTINNTNTNGKSNCIITNTTERIINKSRTVFDRIETKINKIKGNISSRDHLDIVNQSKDHSQNESQSKDDYDDSSNTFNINDYTLKRKLHSSKSNTNVNPTTYLYPKSKSKGIIKRNKIINTKDMNSRYELTNIFLNECNSQLSPQNFEAILSLFQLIKDNAITPENSYRKIKELIQSNKPLIPLLDSIFIIE